jgi:hypothetical protein
MRERTSRSASCSDSRLEAARQLVRAAHRLAEQDAADRQRLLHERGHVGQAALALGGDPLALAADPPVSQTKNGSSASEKTARRQSERHHRAIVASTVVTLETIEVAVDVTTFCTPPMSLAIRDWTSPVRVRVKKASDRRCRCR